MRWFLSDESDPCADAVLERLLREPELFAVPELFFFEVYAVLARVHPTPIEVYVESFLLLTEAGLFRHPMTSALAEHAARFSTQGLTGYDASYAALASEMGCTWLTFDSRAHEKIRSIGVSTDLNRGLPPDWK